MTPTSVFFAHPEETMDAIGRDSFLGILLLTAGAGLFPLGGFVVSARDLKFTGMNTWL